MPPYAIPRCISTVANVTDHFQHSLLGTGSEAEHVLIGITALIPVFRIIVFLVTHVRLQSRNIPKFQNCCCCSRLHIQYFFLLQPHTFFNIAIFAFLALLLSFHVVRHLHIFGVHQMFSVIIRWCPFFWSQTNIHRHITHSNRQNCRAMARVLSCQLPNAASKVRFQAKSCGILVDKLAQDQVSS